MLWWEPQLGTFQMTPSLSGLCSLVGVSRHNGHRRATRGLHAKWAWRKLSGGPWHHRERESQAFGQAAILGRWCGGWVGPWSTGLIIAVILSTKLTFTSKWGKLSDCPNKNCCWALISVGWNSDASKLYFGQLAVAIHGLRGWLKPGMAARPDTACCVFYYDVAALHLVHPASQNYNGLDVVFPSSSPPSDLEVVMWMPRPGLPSRGRLRKGSMWGSHHLSALALTLERAEREGLRLLVLQGSQV